MHRRHPKELSSLSVPPLPYRHALPTKPDRPPIHYTPNLSIRFSFHISILSLSLCLVTRCVGRSVPYPTGHLQEHQAMSPESPTPSHPIPVNPSPLLVSMDLVIYLSRVKSTATIYIDGLASNGLGCGQVAHSLRDVLGVRSDLQGTLLLAAEELIDSLFSIRECRPRSYGIDSNEWCEVSSKHVSEIMEAVLGEGVRQVVGIRRSHLLIKNIDYAWGRQPCITPSGDGLIPSFIHFTAKHRWRLEVNIHRTIEAVGVESFRVIVIKYGSIMHHASNGSK